MEKVLEYCINLCYNYIEKGGDCMYSAEMLLGKEYFSNKKELKDSHSARSFREFWRNFTLLKTMVKDPNFDKIVKDNIVTDKNIKSGTPIIKGTRISTNDIMRILTDDYEIEDIMKNFPTIKSEEQIIAAMVYEIREWNFIFAFYKYVRNHIKG